MDWYAIYVRSQHEAYVAEHLRQVSIEHYLPLYRRIHRWSDRNKMIDVPVLPSYVFGRFEEANRMAVLTAPGVVRILGHDGRLEAIPAAEIDIVRALVGGGALPEEVVRALPDKGVLMRLIRSQ